MSDYCYNTHAHAHAFTQIHTQTHTHTHTHTHHRRTPAPTHTQSAHRNKHSLATCLVLQPPQCISTFCRSTNTCVSCTHPKAKKNPLRGEKRGHLPPSVPSICLSGQSIDRWPGSDEKAARRGGNACRNFPFLSFTPDRHGGRRKGEKACDAMRVFQGPNVGRVDRNSSEWKCKLTILLNSEVR